MPTDMNDELLHLMVFILLIMFGLADQDDMCSSCSSEYDEDELM